jgi:hypothetical protein
MFQYFKRAAVAVSVAFAAAASAVAGPNVSTGTITNVLASTGFDTLVNTTSLANNNFDGIVMSSIGSNFSLTRAGFVGNNFHARNAANATDIQLASGNVFSDIRFNVATSGVDNLSNFYLAVSGFKVGSRTFDVTYSAADFLSGPTAGSVFGLGGLDVDRLKMGLYSSKQSALDAITYSYDRSMFNDSLGGNTIAIDNLVIGNNPVSFVTEPATAVLCLTGIIGLLAAATRRAAFTPTANL